MSLKRTQIVKPANSVKVILRLFLLIGLYLTAGCNYPKMVAPSSGLPPEDLRSTLAALPHSTAQVGSTQPATEMPVSIKTASPDGMFPDSEMVYSPTSLDFDLADNVQQQAGYLNRHFEMVQKEQMSGIEIVERVALESSINPRLLLALIELRSGWVRQRPDARSADPYPIGFHVGGWEGLYRELVMAATHLNAGYYGWRDGGLEAVQFLDGQKLTLAPETSSGSAAVLNLFAKLYRSDHWQAALYGEEGLFALYQEMFGSPWERAANWEPLIPPGTSQPTLQLPFSPGERWSLTGGPHLSWKTGSPRGAIDLAPVTGEANCAVSYAWITAPAAGVVARSARNVVALDLDGDGYEQTGWVIIFMHVANKERVPAGTRLNLDDRIGHPSCEGGTSTGTHVHIARKLNGEWISVDRALPFILGGWQVYAGEKNYQGGMIKGDQQVMASPVGPRTSIIVR